MNEDVTKKSTRRRVITHVAGQRLDPPVVLRPGEVVEFRAHREPASQTFVLPFAYEWVEQ